MLLNSLLDTVGVFLLIRSVVYWGITAIYAFELSDRRDTICLVSFCLCSKMAAADVRDMLDLPAEGQQQPRPQKKQKAVEKRPGGL